ncbi:MAG: hypothetical protein JNK21_05315, partial [Rhodospirillaceae bacterium]|nr:hypothetical protein [Rhodospirillaceae bacterium]
QRIRIAGLVLVRQRPGSAKGVTFITLEDETGNANLVVWKDNFEKYRRTIMTAGLVGCVGRIQREGIVIHVVVEHLENLTPLLSKIGEAEHPLISVLSRADEATKGHGKDTPLQIGDDIRAAVWRHPKAVNVIAEVAAGAEARGQPLVIQSRDFH